MTNWHANLTVDALYELFPSRLDQPEIEPVTSDAVPEPYRELLVHTHHMTVAVEEFFGEPVNVCVQEVVRNDDDYARKILLKLRDAGTVVQFGIVQIDLEMLAPDVSEAIVSQKIPLGRILIQNEVLRTVNPIGYFRVHLSKLMAEWFGAKRGDVTYGRIGVITADGKPAIRVAEILAPIAWDKN